MPDNRLRLIRRRERRLYITTLGSQLLAELAELLRRDAPTDPSLRTSVVRLAIRQCPKGDADLVTTKTKIPGLLGERLSPHPLEVVE